MSPSVLKSFRENPEYKDLYCSTCNSLIPAPGFFCVQCGPPEGPIGVKEELTLLKTTLRITLLTLLFLIIAVFKLDINMMEVFSINQDEKQMKIAEDKDCKIIDSIPKGTQVMVNGVEGDWSKIKYNSGPNNLNTGWIATRLLDSEIK